MRLDKRPLAEIMRDEIPYDRFEREHRIMHRAGFRTYQEWFAARGFRK